MNEQEIIDGNKLIANFMGVKPTLNESSGTYGYSDMPWFTMTNKIEDIVMVAIAEYVKYHSSWDWLMPVVIKINTLGNFEYNVEINTMDVCVWLDEAGKMTQVAESTSSNNPSELIKSVYECVINFIKWYNERIQN